MKKFCLNIIIILILFNVPVKAQTFVGKHDKTNKFDFSLKINKDNSAIFIYKLNNRIYAEYDCVIKHTKGSTYQVIGELKFGHFAVKSKDNDSIYINADPNSKKLCIPPKDYIIFPKSGHTRYLIYFNKTNSGYSTPIDTSEFNPRKGQNYIRFQICRKNPITDSFIDFKIPYGYSSSIKKGEKIDFQIIMKNDSIKTYNCKKDFGNFRLKRKSGA